MGIHVDVTGSAVGYFIESYRNKRTNYPTPFGNTAYSIYLGSRTSQIIFRIYDKQLEQNHKKNAAPITEPWVRWEIELHKDRAIAVAMLLISCNDLSSVALGILASYLRLIEKDNVRDSRCSNTEKWNSFICDIKKIRLYQPIPEKTLAEKKAWIISQAAPTLSAIYVMEGDLSFFYDVIEKGSLRYSRELIRIIQKEWGIY